MESGRKSNVPPNKTVCAKVSRQKMWTPFVSSFNLLLPLFLFYYHHNDQDDIPSYPINLSHQDHNIFSLIFFYRKTVQSPQCKQWLLLLVHQVCYYSLVGAYTLLKSEWTVNIHLNWNLTLLLHTILTKRKELSQPSSFFSVASMMFDSTTSLYNT